MHEQEQHVHAEQLASMLNLARDLDRGTYSGWTGEGFLGLDNRLGLRVRHESGYIADLRDSSELPTHTWRVQKVAHCYTTRPVLPDEAAS